MTSSPPPWQRQPPWRRRQPPAPNLAAAAALLTLSLAGCGAPKGAIAKVNGEWVDETEFQAYLDHKRIRIRDDAHKKRVMDEFLKRIALADAIEDEDLPDRARIEAELAEARREILISRYIDASLKEAVSDEGIRKYYDEHLQEFSARRVHVAHIMARTNREMSEADKLAKLTTMREAHAKLVAGGDFSELAKQYSEDLVSGKRGGDLGRIKDDAIDPAIAAAVAKLKPGEFSGPVETKFGYHVIKVIEGPTVQQRDFQAAQGEIRYRLRNESREKLLEKLEKDIKIKVVEKS